MECSSYQVHNARREDFNEGWIWIRSNNLFKQIEGGRRIVHLKMPGGNKGVYCEAVWADDLYLKKFTLIDHSTADCHVFVSNWYRHRLQIGEGQQVKFDIGFPRRWWHKLLWQCFACFQHPQIVVALAIALGIVAVGLGVIGSGFAIVGIQSWGGFGAGVGIGFIVAGAATVALGIVPLLRRQ